MKIPFGEYLSNRYIDYLVDRTVQSWNGSVDIPPVFHESGSVPDPRRLVTKDVWDRAKYSRKLKRHLTERRSSYYATGKSSNNFTVIRSPYRYDRISAFFNKEAYFSRSVSRQIETIFRNGYQIFSKDEKALRCVQRSMSRLLVESRVSMEQMVWRWVRDLTLNGVIILHKVRTTRKDAVDPKDPGVRYLRRLRSVDPSHVSVYLNDDSEIVSVYDTSRDPIARKQFTTYRRGKVPGIPADDISIVTVYDAGYEVFPMPPCFQMLDDIMTLRSLEETVELLCFQFGSPLLHVKVGTESEPAIDTEVRSVSSQIYNMVPNGMISTDHRVSISTVAVQKGVSNLIPYIEHFKNRVIIGSGTSPVSVGEGDTSNRATSESIDDALADHCTYLGNLISSLFNTDIFPDILMENGYSADQILDKDGQCIVTLKFNEMRLEKQVMYENSVLNLWNSFAVTHDEMRILLGRRPLSSAEIEHLHPGYAKAKTQGFNPTMVDPVNQHGKKGGPGSKKD